MAKMTRAEFEGLLGQLDSRVMDKGETPAQAAEAVTGGNPALDQRLVAAYSGQLAAFPREDGRVDCPACGHHGSRCQEDLDNGSTICHTTGQVIQ